MIVLTTIILLINAVIPFFIKGTLNKWSNFLGWFLAVIWFLSFSYK